MSTDFATEACGMISMLLFCRHPSRVVTYGGMIGRVMHGEMIGGNNAWWDDWGRHAWWDNRGNHARRDD